ncbi:MAG: NAD-dependent epimerase/dehydratase family protein [Candidatus Dormibacteria bacterium]
MTAEKFLVTGALGCIGSWTVRELSRRGLPVVALDLATDPRRLREISTAVEVANVIFERGDVSDVEYLGNLVATHGITRIVHLAALQIPFCKANPVLGAQVNVVGTVNVLEAARRSAGQVRGVTYMSSIGMYDAADVDAGSGRIEANTSAHPRTLYGVYKLANEGTASVYWEDSGVPSIGLRPYIVYGVGRDQGLTSAPTMAMLAAARGERFHIPYGGSAVYQYAEDVAATTVAAAMNLESGAAVFNLHGQTVPMAEVVEAIGIVAPSAMITYDETPLPLPAAVESDALRAFLGTLPETSFAEGTRRTVELFRARAAAA